MHKELLVARHGKSDWSQGLPDFRRPLKGRGERESKGLGRWLAKQAFVPDLVVSSTAERARDTALTLCKAMGYDKASIVWCDDLYLAEVPFLLDLVQQMPREVSRVMLVGHNPGLEELIMALASGKLEMPPDGKLLPTATVVGLAFDGSWKQVKPGSGRFMFRQRGVDE